MADPYYELLKRKKVSFEPRGLKTIPALNSALFPHQLATTEFALKTGCAAAFLDCVAGETMIETIHGPARIDDLASRGLPIVVWSVGPDGPRLSAATAPFRKGRARLFEIVTNRGRRISVTARHQILSSDGWLFGSEVEVGAQIRVYVPSHLQSNSEFSPLVSRQDDPHLLQTRANYSDRCYPSFRQYGQRPQSAIDTCRVDVPSQADVHELGCLSSHMDVLGNTLEYSHRYHNNGLPSMPGSHLQGNCIEDGPECQLRSFCSEQSELNNCTSLLSPSIGFHTQSCGGHRPYISELFLDVPYSTFEPHGFDTVVSVKYIRTDYYYDMHVPGDQNYIANGFCNHNTGLGKALISLDWSRVLVERTNKSGLILAPLAVGPQHQREAEKFGIDARYIREPSEIDHVGIWITNYERLHKFDVSQFCSVVLDESSLIKGYTSATTRQLMETFKSTPYRLACTATPAPNDHMELGQHCQFLGAMDSNEMLARWFIADQANMGKYRLKKAAVNPFWDWVASWARCISKPSDVGFDDAGFVLPELVMHQHIVRSDVSIDAGAEKDGQSRMFRIPEMSATSIHKEKRLSVDMRADAIAAAVAAEPNEPWVIWCDTDYEADAICERIPVAVEVRGSMKAEMKEERIVAFSDGKISPLVSKPSICGFGLNWQHCARVGFVGLSFSYEQFYQSIRRCWRFGQKRAVHVHVAMADTEKAIWDTVTRKAGDHDTMKLNMTAAMRRAMSVHKVFEDYKPTANLIIPEWCR